MPLNFFFSFHFTHKKKTQQNLVTLEFIHHWKQLENKQYSNLRTDTMVCIFLLLRVKEKFGFINFFVCASLWKEHMSTR